MKRATAEQRRKKHRAERGSGREEQDRELEEKREKRKELPLLLSLSQKRRLAAAVAEGLEKSLQPAGPSHLLDHLRWEDLAQLFFCFFLSY